MPKIIEVDVAKTLAEILRVLKHISDTLSSLTSNLLEAIENK